MPISRGDNSQAMRCLLRRSRLIKSYHNFPAYADPPQAELKSKHLVYCSMTPEHIQQLETEFRDGVRGVFDTPEYERACDQQQDRLRIIAAAITCPRGHLFLPETTRINKQGGRVCKICDRAKGKRWRATDPNKQSASSKNWRAAHLEYARSLCRGWHVTNFSSLSDAYIKKTLKQQAFQGTDAEIPEGLIALIREQKFTEREIKQLQKGVV